MLYKLLVQCIQDNDLIPMVNYAENLAKERFASGFDLQEVQVAFNVLEESLWKQLIKACPPAELAKALGLVSTVQGAGKDALAREYVALASQINLPSINLEALFNGTTG